MPNLLPTIILCSMWCGSVMIAFTPLMLANESAFIVRMLTLALAPVLFVISFPTIGALLTKPAQKGIKRGKFPREAFHPVYLKRRIYGAAWTQVYYFKPVYAAILAIPVLKKFVLRSFGYKGSTNFVVYPDTWIRDLPVLDVGEGAYLSNRATIGTNMCLADGTIYVAPIKIRNKGLIGHLAMLAPGVTIGEAAEVGVGCAIGIMCRLADGASVKPSCTLNHGAIIGAGAEVGTMSFVGLRAEIGAGVSLPAGSNIPAGAVISNQADVAKYYSSETEMLNQHRETVFPSISKLVSSD